MSIKRGLHKMGELCKICGVTRRMVLNFEEHGLIKAMKTEEDSGYRYYGAPSVARICHIRGLQRLGFSLPNIKKFICGDFNTLNEHLERLYALKKEIEWQINRTEALLTRPGEYSVHTEYFPGGDFILMHRDCKNTEDRFWLLYDITDYIFNKGYRISDKGQLLVSIIDSFVKEGLYGMTTAAWKMNEANEETVYFEGTKVLCVNVRGVYSELEKAAEILKSYVLNGNYEITGGLIITYLTSPQSHAAPEDYVTQLMLPVK